MAENGVDLQHGGDPVPFSNGNPFLADLEAGVNPDGREAPVQSEVLIDFEGPEAIPETIAEVRAVPPSQMVTEAALLDDFDPLQRPPGDGARVGSMAAEPEAVAATDLLGMMDPHGRPGFVEVFAAPPPGSPEEETAKTDAAVTSPEITSPPSEVTSQAEVTSPPELASPPEVARDDTKEPPNDAKVKVGGGVSKGVAKTSGNGGGGGTKSEHVEARADRKVKVSPRPGSTGGGGGPVAAAGVGGGGGGGGGGGDKSKDGATKTVDAKSKTAITTTKAPKSAIPSAESPRKTRREIKTVDAEGEKASLTNSKTDFKRSAESATRKPRNSSSADESAIKSPSPGSTPRTSVSASADVKSARSKIGSLDNTKHTPGGGNVKIPTQKIDVSNVTSRCGSKANMTHVPGGGQKKIESRKLDWKVESKIGSLDNTKHKPGGGEKKIESKKLDWKGESKVGSMDNAQHKPGGGEKKIESVKLDFKDKAQSKVGSKDYIDHKPGGGAKKIETVKLDFKEKAQSKVGSRPGLNTQNDQDSDATATSRTASGAETAEEGAVHN